MISQTLKRYRVLSVLDFLFGLLSLLSGIVITDKNHKNKIIKKKNKHNKKSDRNIYGCYSLVTYIMQNYLSELRQAQQ
jgi:hypothetical protein